jgi:hypothetical protein
MVWRNKPVLFGLIFSSCRKIGTILPRISSTRSARESRDKIALWCASARKRDKMQERPMKLNSMQVKQTLNQMKAHVLPDDHPAATQFTDLFGDHTFFLDANGLKVLEPTDAVGMQSGEVVCLADWTDATLTTLRPHEPELTGTIITFREMIH